MEACVRVSAGLATVVSLRSSGRFPSVVVALFGIVDDPYGIVRVTRLRARLSHEAS
jgi:hypothetical protein